MTVDELIADLIQLRSMHDNAGSMRVQVCNFAGDLAIPNVIKFNTGKGEGNIPYFSIEV